MPTPTKVSTSLINSAIPQIVGGRITIASNTPVSTAATATNTQVFWTPYLSPLISLYNTTTGLWDILTHPDLPLTVPNTSNTKYRLFAYNNAGVVAIESAAGNTALARQDGVLVKSGDASRRYLGEFATSIDPGVVALYKSYDGAVGPCYIGIWNLYNQVRIDATSFIGTASYTYATNTIRQIGGYTGAALIAVTGPVLGTVVTAQAMARISGGTTYELGFGRGSTTVFNGSIASGTGTNMLDVVDTVASFDEILQLNTLERGVSGTTTVTGGTNYTRTTYSLMY